MSKSGSNSTSEDDNITVQGNVISNGVDLSVNVPPDSNEFTVTVKVDGQRASGTYNTVINPDGSSSFKRSVQEFNQEKNIIPLVNTINNQNKSYPRLKKAIESHGGLCDIMCNHIVMEDLISEKNKSATPYRMPEKAKKDGTKDSFRHLGKNTLEKLSSNDYNNSKTLKNSEDKPAVDLQDLSPHEKAILDKLEQDVAPLHFLKQVSIFQIMKAATFAKLPHNYLSSDDQLQLNDATKALHSNLAKDQYLEFSNDIIKETGLMQAEEQELVKLEKNLEDLKNQTHFFDGRPITNEDDIALKASLVRDKESAIEKKKESISKYKSDIEGLKYLVENIAGNMNRILSTAVDNIEPGKYAKFMAYDKDGLDFSGHTMLIRNNGEGKFSFFDPDRGLISNVDKAELLIILDRAFLECDRKNIAVINVHKMLPKQELKQEQKQKQKQKQKQEKKQESNKENTEGHNPLFINKSMVSHYNVKREFRGYFSSLKEGVKSDAPDVHQAKQRKNTL